MYMTPHYTNYRNLIGYFWIILAGYLSTCQTAQGQTRQNYLIASGGQQLFIIDPTHSNTDSIAYRWQWHVSETVDLPEEYRRLFRTIDECKPIGNGDTLLITSSSGGALQLERKTKRALFYAQVPNAHSIELLPNNRVVVALSYAPTGNSVKVYDLDKPNDVIFQDTLYSGHGVVWMPKQQRLYALGFNQLKAYTLSEWETQTPSLHLANEWQLPDEGGHDLIAISDEELLLSTDESVWHFNTKNGQITPFAPLKGVAHVKSINYDKETGQLVYTKGETNWWTHNIYIENPKQTITLPPDFRMYKVRILATGTGNLK